MKLFDDVRRKVLDNGLEILVREDRNSPVVALNFFVRVGSLNEDEAIAGWSHGVEHMLFKGTERRGPGDIAREIQNAGGETNAGTGYESTNYYIVLPSENFETALDIHADVLRHSTFDEYELEKERQVLIKENEMYRDRPRGFGYTWEALLEEAFTTHRYGRPIGGPDENLLRVDRDAVFAHKEKYYVPGNITYVVVGDVDAETVFRAMEAKLGDWSHTPVEPDHSPPEPPQGAFRFVEMWRDVEKSYVKIGFHIPPELDSDTEALLVLGHILATGKTSRLYRRVREEQNLIYDASVMEATGRDPGYLVIEFSCEVAKTQEAVAAVYDQILRFQSEPVTAEELDRTLHTVRCDTVFTLETMEGQASMLGHFALLGDYRLAGSHLDRLARVDANRILDAARRYGSLHQSTLLVLSPDGERASWGPAEIVAGWIEAGLDRRSPAPPVVSEPARARPMPTASGRPRGAVDVLTLSTGTRVVWQEDGRLPLTALAAYLPAGSGVETAEEAGLTQLAQICMTKGAGGLSAADLDDALEDLGAKLRPFASRDVCGFGLGVVREHFLEGLDLFGRVLTDPAFLPDTVARERDRMKAQLAALRDDTVSYTVTKLFRMLYGEHAYGRPVLGTEPSLDALDAAALRAWHGEAYDASRLVIAVVGDADREATLARLETILGRLPRGSAARIIPAPVFPERGSRSDFGKDVSQAVVVLGYPGPEHRSEDRYALDVWNATMSGMGNRLFTRLRDEKHLCYFTGSFAQPLTGGGVLGAYVGTGPDQVEDAIAALIGELERGAREPATDEEILRAKNTLAGGHLIDMQTRMAWAGTYARDEVLGLGYGETERYLREIRLVTAEEARSAAARYVDPGRLTVAVLQPEANAPAPADV